MQILYDMAVAKRDNPAGLIERNGFKYYSHLKTTKTIGLSNLFLILQRLQSVNSKSYIMVYSQLEKTFDVSDSFLVKQFGSENIEKYEEKHMKLESFPK